MSSLFYDVTVRFEWLDGIWVAPLDTPYGIVEVIVDGTEEAPNQRDLAAFEQYLQHAHELTEKTRKRLRFAFLYRLIRIAVNDSGRVGLQFRNRFTGAQPLLFSDE